MAISDEQHPSWRGQSLFPVTVGRRAFAVLWSLLLLLVIALAVVVVTYLQIRGLL
jgi:hypothetical protein